MTRVFYGGTPQDWYRDAACRGLNDDRFFPLTEDSRSLDFVRRAYCNTCPVRQECLDTAMAVGESGYWGGTSTAERRALSKNRSRAKCPLCLGRSVRAVDRSEICLFCGASWAADERPSGREEAVAS
jgi:WhiB family redox-sensing transcriptional regulator